MKKVYYCGPHWIPNWMRRPLSIWFNDSCRIHDYRYYRRIKDDGTTITKIEADKEMLCNFINDSEGLFIKEVAACIGFIMVRALNKFSWKDKK